MATLIYSTQKKITKRRRIGEHRPQTIRYWKSLSHDEQLIIEWKLFTIKNQSNNGITP
jgi:hypothetical protein